MIKKLTLPLILLLLAYFIISSENIKIIATGIAIFMIGMHFMENGFKLFSGGTLEKVLEKFTSTNIKAVLTGFVTTSIVQSSSLISVIVISFLTVELITLTQGMAIVFGSNLGSTTTAWIVSSFGLKIKISLYAMPLIIFGVIFRFSKSQKYIGLGNILLGLGFIFLGISYMKDGFETLKDAINLASYSVGGFTGIFIYIIIGAIATVVIQSSSATMAIIITALSGANIIYIDAIALAIGANIGTTVTAIIGSLTSNENGKRLAFGHFVFNIITAAVAVALIYTLKDFVDLIAPYFGIDSENYTMKLALFHTIFNLLGIVILFPFIAFIVTLSKKLIKDKIKKASKPIYLDESNIKIPYNAMVSVQKEVLHLYENAQKAILHALSIHTSNLNEEKDIDNAIKNPAKIDTNLDEIYQNDLKSLYSEIIDYLLRSQSNMNEHQLFYIGQLRLSSNIIVKILKDTRDIQRNINIYLYSKNEYIRAEYISLKKELALNILRTNQLRNKDIDDVETSTQIQVYKDNLEELEIQFNKKIDELIRNDKITPKMGTSLINDTGSVINMSKNLFRIANILFVNDAKLRTLGENNENV
ncbi:MAG: Na/Pi cotransporter family protein [Arcobacter sp.]|uniref:Na/Pi cotransporter family protein n=1 Tax=uncultured Arcobacter sp. TaxID=165434 RepID=UPI000CAB9FCF|nr:Na/Pi symporter [uncultured Arcobacter sp.]PLY11294.1 MAG: Na/Pi cotransporter family protein [Arcobacter sp.]